MDKSQMAEILSQEEILRYLELVDRRLYIVIHSGIDWKPEYAQEMEDIDKEIAVLRQKIDAAHAARQSQAPAQEESDMEQAPLPEVEENDQFPAGADEQLEDDPYVDTKLMAEAWQAHLNGGRTGYLFDDDGNEYYTTPDGVRHYTRVEG